MKIFSLVLFVDASNVTVGSDAFAVKKSGFVRTLWPFDTKQALRGSNTVFLLVFESSQSNARLLSNAVLTGVLEHFLFKAPSH